MALPHGFANSEIGLITVFAAILTGRQSGWKLQCFVWESDGELLFPKLNSTQFMNHNIKIPSITLYSPSFKNVCWTEDTQFIFLIFHTFVCNFFPALPVLPCQIYRQMYGKLEKLIKHILTKLHPSNLVNTIFYSVFYIAIHKISILETVICHRIPLQTL